ncbi:Rhomboid protein [Fasciolopsis buskii]|uniref:Rhomboid protein n=1 Tax=Fasciolopsis buskii TaxID=27845 RepID=A0A8E0VMW2_9TREM|nr:Rhomboid protein [Fasciolopsis buski]
MLQPHARLCVPFVVDLVPHSFEAGSAALVLLTLEFCSSFIFASRSPVDHAAHMGGLIFGMYYGLSGSDAIWRRRTAIVSWWRQLRGE